MEEFESVVDAFW